LNRVDELKKYFAEKLQSMNELNPYLKYSSVVSVELDDGVVYDLMVVLPDMMFEGNFKTRFGECFVVNDQEHCPPVFTRFKSQRWLISDLARRLPIALWIFGKSIVIQDPNGTFENIVHEHNLVFQKNVKNILRRKYIEFRSDRHNLRRTVYRRDDLATNILKGNVVKIAIEILMLSYGKPYPYKKWLSFEARKFAEGPKILEISSRFLGEMDPVKIIDQSDELVGVIVELFKDDPDLPPTFLSEWWLNLS